MEISLLAESKSGAQAMREVRQLPCPDISDG